MLQDWALLNDLSYLIPHSRDSCYSWFFLHCRQAKTAITSWSKDTELQIRGPVGRLMESLLHNAMRWCEMANWIGGGNIPS